MKSANPRPAFMYYDFYNKEINIVELMNHISFGGNPIKKFHDQMSDHIKKVKDRQERKPERLT